MNDGLRTNLFVRYPPETIACACIFLAARQLQVCVLCVVHVFIILSLPRFLFHKALHGGYCLTHPMRKLR